MQSRLPAAAAVLLGLWPSGTSAQEAKEPRRVRVGVGAQVTPRYPGADKMQVGPFLNVDVARGNTPFIFEAPDETAALTLYNRDGLGLGPSANLQNSRRNRDVGVPIGRVNFTVEAGGFVQYQLAPGLRVRADLRRGLGGHDGFVGEVSADVFSIGPRLTLSNRRYQRAYFGVDPAQAIATGLPVFAPEGGLQSVGATAGLMYQFSPRVGLMSYARYDRLVSDPSDSPLVRRFGNRNQFSGGLGLTYTFTR
jgi:MipA family protein